MSGVRNRHYVRERLKGLAWFLTVMAMLALAFIIAHFATRLLYQRLGATPAPLLDQVVTSMGGLFLFGLVMTLLSRVFRAAGWAQQMRVFGPLLAAMEQISRGDFKVRVEHPHGESAANSNDPITKLFVGVNQMAQELNQMEAMRQEFISNVSHEIQSPLTSIRGFAQALKNEQLSPQDRAHYLSIIETESMRLSKLSDNLLALAALEAENIRFEPKPYRLDKQITQLILACEPQWTSKNIELDVATDEVTINADEDLLSQVWVNLLHNAIKFTPEGGKIQVQLHRHASAGADTGADLVEFHISDTGPGIAAADQSHIFERFFKADKSRNRALGGNGLGLSIAKKIVELHGGSIDLASQLGVGSTFSVTLPANPQSARLPTAPLPPAPLPTAQLPPLPTGSKLRSS